MVGVSFRPLQARALGLDPERALTELVGYPFPLIRFAAYWNQLEPQPGRLATDELDHQLDLAAGARKKVVLCVGAVKAFGYPELFMPANLGPLPEGKLIGPGSHRQLADAASAFVARVTDRYRGRKEIIAWQVEHEPVDPLGMEHSWRLSAELVRQEVAAVRATDPTRPVLLTGFLPTSLPVRLTQRWRTRGQGDSLAVAGRLADIVGVNFYPRHAVARLGSRTVYLAGRVSRRAAAQLAATGKQLMVSEVQAEPWETVTTPPSLVGRGMYSCLPEHVIANYNAALRLGAAAPGGPRAVVFWGAEYWLRRRDDGDDRYLAAFSRILAEG